MSFLKLWCTVDSLSSISALNVDDGGGGAAASGNVIFSSTRFNNGARSTADNDGYINFFVGPNNIQNEWSVGVWIKFLQNSGYSDLDYIWSFYLDDNNRIVLYVDYSLGKIVCDIIAGGVTHQLSHTVVGGWVSGDLKFVGVSFKSSGMTGGVTGRMTIFSYPTPSFVSVQTSDSISFYDVLIDLDLLGYRLGGSVQTTNRSVNTLVDNLKIYNKARESWSIDYNVEGLAAPLNCQASDGVYLDKVAVSWNFYDSADYYEVYRSENGVTFSLVDTVATPSYDDMDVDPGIIYYYKIKSKLYSFVSDEYSNVDTGYINYHPLSINSNSDIRTILTEKWIGSLAPGFIEFLGRLNLFKLGKGNSSSVTGFMSEPFVIDNTNDQLKIDINNSGVVVITLAHGTGLTAKNIANDITLKLISLGVEYFLISDSSGSVKIESLLRGSSSEIDIQSVLNSCYTTLGLSVGVVNSGYTPTMEDTGLINVIHSGLVKSIVNVAAVYGTAFGPFTITSGVNDKLQIDINGTGSRIITLEPGTNLAVSFVANDIKRKINSYFRDSIIDVFEKSGGLVIETIVSGLNNSIEIQSVTNNCYTTLGFSVGVVSTGYIHISCLVNESELVGERITECGIYDVNGVSVTGSVTEPFDSLRKSLSINVDYLGVKSVGIMDWISVDNLMAEASLSVVPGEHGEIINPQFPIQNACDGNYSTLFKVNPGYPASVTMEWESPVSINKIVLHNFMPDALYSFQYEDISHVFHNIAVGVTGDGDRLDVNCGEIIALSVIIDAELTDGGEIYIGEIIVGSFPSAEDLAQRMQSKIDEMYGKSVITVSDDGTGKIKLESKVHLEIIDSEDSLWEIIGVSVGSYVPSISLLVAISEFPSIVKDGEIPNYFRFKVNKS